MKIYILYTGGTIGCVGKPLTPLSGPEFVQVFGKLLLPAIHSQFRECEVNFGFFETCLDSSNMQPADWVKIARNIAENYRAHDAFLVRFTAPFRASARFFAYFADLARH
jgi:L-asparaginase